MVYCLCGKAGAGKTTFARTRLACVTLSCDQLMLRLFPEQLGDRHHEISRKCTDYLLDLAVELDKCETDTALDFGFWTKAERARIRAFFGARGIPVSFLYLDTPEAERLRRLEKRNASGDRESYTIDEHLRLILDARFEPPTPGEMDAVIQ